MRSVSTRLPAAVTAVVLMKTLRWLIAGLPPAMAVVETVVGGRAPLALGEAAAPSTKGGTAGVISRRTRPLLRGGWQ